MGWFAGRRALGHRNYRLFLAGQGVSLIGTWMQQVGLNWLVYRTTGSPALLGLVSFSGQIPSFFVAPWAGVMADRWNRHRALVAVQSLAMIQAVLLVLLTGTGLINVWLIVALSVAMGVINGFDMPLRQSFLIEMVTRKEDLPNAIALNSSIVNMARLVGPAAAGLLIAIGGELTCFVINAISYLAVLAALLMMRDLPVRQRRVHPAVWHGLKEGVRYAYSFGPIRTLLTMMAVVSLTAIPMAVLLPVFAGKILPWQATSERLLAATHLGRLLPESVINSFQQDSTLLGLLMAASGLGALSSAIYLAARRHILGLGRQATLAAAVLGVAMVAFSYSHQIWLSLILLSISGFCTMLQMSTANTLLQTVVDEDKRGRVMSLYTMSFIGTAPLGSLLAGSLAQHLGAPMAVRLGGCACIVGAIWFLLRYPKLRREIRPIYQRVGILPPITTAIQTSSELMSPPEDLG